MKLRTQSLPIRWLAWSMMFFGMFQSLTAGVIYVDASAGGANNGSSWANAYTDLQDALSTAVAGDEIWIAAGVYKPSVQLDLDGNGPDPREVTFQLPNGVMLYGGFAGGEASLEDRDWDTHLTILSGDIDNNDINGDGNEIAENTGELVGANAYHVIVTESVNASTGIDGIVVTAGYAGNEMEGFTETNPHTLGGGWHDVEAGPGNISSPTILHSRFAGNFASVRGGALRIGSYTMGTYEPLISHTVFTGNEAIMLGGAILFMGTDATIDSCLFEHNEATNFSEVGDTSPGAGGAVGILSASADFHHCMFVDNHATGTPNGPWEGGGGGAAYINQNENEVNTFGQVHTKFLNCGFYNNSTGGNGEAWGGAMKIITDAGRLKVDIWGSVFSGNSAADDGGAIAVYARKFDDPASFTPDLDLVLANCTLYENMAGNWGGGVFTKVWTHDGSKMLSIAMVNTILYENAAMGGHPEVYHDDPSINTVSYSLIQGSGGSGGGWDVSVGSDAGDNIDATPKFVDAADPLGPDGIGGTADDGLHLEGGILASPGVDRGNNWALWLVGLHTITGEARGIGNAVDMGAYETFALWLVAEPVIFVVKEWNKKSKDEPFNPNCRDCSSAWTLELDAQTPNPTSQGSGTRFHWVEQGKFMNHGEYATLEGTLADVNNPHAQFAVHLKLIKPHNWSEWSGKRRTYFVDSQVAQRTAQRSHKDWTYWELSPESKLIGRGDISGTLSLTPISANAGFQQGSGANALDADMGLGGKFQYRGRVAYGSEESRVKGSGSIHMDMEKEE